MAIFAQIDSAINSATEITKSAKDLGADAFLTTLLIVILSAIGGFYIWKVAIPNGQAFRESTKALSEKVATTAEQTTTALGHTVVIRGNTETIENQVDKLIKCKNLEMQAIEKVAEACKVDISRELAELRGRLAS